MLRVVPLDVHATTVPAYAHPVANLALRRPPLRTILLVGVAVLALVGSLIAVAAVRRPSEQPVVAFLGDSYMAGSTADTGFRARFPGILAAQLDVQSIVVAVPGAGYVQPGVTGERYEQEVDAIPEDAATVVVYGSRNDPMDGTSASNIGAAAARLVQAVRVRAPAAQIVVVGPSFVEDPSPAGGLANADSIRTACEQAGVRFVDAHDWLHGVPSSYIGADLVHPTDAGHAYLARKFAPLVEDAVREAGH